MNKELRLLAAEIIVSSRLSKSSKLQLLNFVKEDASDAQVKALLLDGEVVYLDKEAEKIVNARFEQSSLNEAGSIAGTIASWTPLFKKWRDLAAIYSDAHVLCGKYKVSNDRDACLAKARINFAKKKIEVLKQARGKCGEKKNPMRCRNIIATELAKQERKLKKQQNKLDKLVMKGRGYAGEPGDIVASRT